MPSPAVESPKLSKMQVSINADALHQKLRSSYGTAPSEISEIDAIVALGSKDLEDYDLELQDLQSRILQIKHRRRRLEEYISNVQSLKSPIRKLPNELLLRIFSFCCIFDRLEEAISRKPEYPTTPATALSISAVCTRWHSLAESNPSLWSSLSLRLSGSGDDSFCQQSLVSKLEHYLERSKSHPLSLAINCGSWDNDETDIPDHPALMLLVTHCQRWQHLSFTGILEGDLGHDSLSSSPLEFSALETLRINDEAFDNFTDLSLFRNAPRLHALALHWSAYDQDADGTIFPWVQITTLRISTQYVDIFRAVSQCPRLASLTITCNSPTKNSPAVEIPDSPIVSHLFSLSLEYEPYGFTEEDHAVADLLTSLSLPSLTTLTVIHRGLTYPSESKPMDWPAGAIRSFLARSQSALTVLFLQGTSLSDDDAVALLRQIPALEDLTIQEECYSLYHYISPLTETFIRSLHAFARTKLHTSYRPLVPRLKSLSLKLNKEKPTDDLIFIETISSRWLPDPEYAAEVGLACLQSVELLFHKHSGDFTNFSLLKPLEKAGLCFFVGKY